MSTEPNVPSDETEECFPTDPATAVPFDSVDCTPMDVAEDMIDRQEAVRLLDKIIDRSKSRSDRSTEEVALLAEKLRPYLSIKPIVGTTAALPF
jgi:hypothetical protein